MKWICSQIGGREFYAYPKALMQLGELDRFYTDIWFSPRFVNFAGKLGLPTSLISGRTDAAVDAYAHSAGNLSAILFDKLHAKKDDYRFYCDYGAWFSKKVGRGIRKRRGYDAFFTYNTSGLETFRMLKGARKLVLGQTDPGKWERELVKEEFKKFPDWPTTDSYHNAPDFYYDRTAEEWALADQIVVNSTWSKKALIQQGVADNKIGIIPLTYEPVKKGAVQKAVHRKTLQVLWIGNVILRKGIQYLLQSAAKLEKEDVQFTIIGPVQIAEKIVRAAPANVKFLGKIDRSEVYRYYTSSDLFVLPTISDGFAITQIEAMSYGLPVIATTNCGDVVTDGLDGHVIPPFDPAAITASILRYHHDRDYLYTSSLKALEKSRQFSMKHFVDHVRLLF